jgi:hypothetical protein
MLNVFQAQTDLSAGSQVGNLHARSDAPASPTRSATGLPEYPNTPEYKFRCHGVYFVL